MLTLVQCRSIITQKHTKKVYFTSFPFYTSVHKDVSERLKKEDPDLYSQVKGLLEINKQERHIRGGLATREKYREIAKRRKKIEN